MTDFEKMFRHSPKTKENSQGRFVPNEAEPSAGAALRGVQAERTPISIAKLAQHTNQSSRTQTSQDPTAFHWIPSKPAMLSNDQRDVSRRRSASTSRKTGALSIVFFALHTVTAHLDPKDILSALKSDTVTTAPTDLQGVVHFATSYNSDPISISSLQAVPSPSASDKTANMIANLAKTEAEQTATPQPQLRSDMDVVQTTVEPAASLTVARYYRQPENATPDNAPPASFAAQPKDPPPPIVESATPLIRPIQRQNAPAPIARSEWEIEKSRGVRQQNLERPNVVDTPREPIPTIKHNEVKPRQLHTTKTGRRPMLAKQPTESGNAEAVIGQASGVEKSRRLRRANESTPTIRPALERIEQNSATTTSVQSSHSERRVQKRRPQGQARVEMAESDRRSRRSFLGAANPNQRHDQNDAPTHLTVLGMRIPMLKPIWADDVFNKGTR